MSDREGAARRHGPTLRLPRRLGLVLALLFPAAGVIGLLAWGLAQSGGTPGGLVNTKLGAVKIQRGAARPFELTLFGGETLALEDLKGKVVMVDFWASWCPPCRQEASALAQVFRQYQGKGVAFVGIAIWDAEADATSYTSRYGITYPNGLDAKGQIAIDYGVTGIPEKYFISRDGILSKKFIGPMDEEKLKGVLNEMLGE